MLLFGWDGDSFTHRLLKEITGESPPDVLARAVGTSPASTPIVSATGGLPSAVVQSAGGVATIGADPRERPTAGCTYYDVPQDRLPVTLAPGAAAVLVALPVVPVGYRGVVRFLGLSTTNAGATQVQTRKNQAPVLPFTAARGAVGSLQDPTRIFVELAPGEVFDLLATNIGFQNIDLAARAIAWYWPES